MAPASRNGRSGPGRSEDDCYGIKGDRKTRKPLVEKKRRARINESLQELRLLLADSDAQTKMENAEVLEMTVKRVESILQNRAKAADSMNREASERFAAGYIQCMHEVHTFVSSCPGIDAAVAADLLNHLLECMPLNGEQRFQDVLTDLLTEPGHYGPWPSESPGDGGGGGGGREGCPSDLSPSPSATSSDDLSSDGEDTESERGHDRVPDDRDVRDLPTNYYSKAMWRPW
ncbi:hypothetical protein NFI96_015277 [Prochilodus magdalenae]|nr:hypothetical protein NFI96_015277 [Prochilodus magdalenae]